MAGPFFKQWRKYRGLTLEKVAERLAFMDDPGIPSTAASLSRVENGVQAYTPRSIEALAEVYQCLPGELLDVDPFQRDELDEVIAGLSKSTELTRARAARLLRALDDGESQDAA
jgi:transcriptional regulator with XRE-family HTH domain